MRKAAQQLIADFQFTGASTQLLRMRRKRRQQSEAAKRRARERFERQFGTLSVEYATCADNEQIDADLAQIYMGKPDVIVSG